MSDYRMEDGWRKISEDGGGYVTSTLFNIVTGDEAHIVTRDYDYSDGSRDDDYWYNAPIDHDAEVMWFRKHKRIGIGVDVMVVKGRKIPHGYVGRVIKTRKIYDCYNRWVATYVVFADGKSTNIDNCEFVA